MLGGKQCDVLSSYEAKSDFSLEKAEGQRPVSKRTEESRVRRFKRPERL